MNDVTFEESTHTYSRGLVTLPSVTTVIKAVFPDELKDIDPAIVESARDRGIEVDRLLTAWLNGASTIPSGTREDSVELFNKLIDGWPFGFCETQVILASDDLAGTLDLLLPLDGAIYDLKTTYNVPKYAPLQLGGYCHLYEAEHGKLPLTCGVVHLTKRQPRKIITYDVTRVTSEFRLLFDFWKMIQRYQGKVK